MGSTTLFVRGIEISSTEIFPLPASQNPRRGTRDRTPRSPGDRPLLEIPTGKGGLPSRFLSMDQSNKTSPTDDFCSRNQRSAEDSLIFAIEVSERFPSSSLSPTVDGIELIFAQVRKMGGKSDIGKATRVGITTNSSIPKNSAQRQDQTSTCACAIASTASIQHHNPSRSKRLHPRRQTEGWWSRGNTNEAIQKTEDVAHDGTRNKGTMPTSIVHPKGQWV